ncbi:MAG: hypothetical protein ABJD97_02935 [Betaproteobacteria bacterium]
MRGQAGLGWLVATGFFLLALCWSPLLPGLLGLESSVAFLAGFALFTSLVNGRRGVPVAVAGACAALVLVCLLLFLVTGSKTLLARLVPVPLLVFAAWQANSVEGLVERLCDAMSAFCVAGVAMCVVGFVYAYLGGQPVLSIVNNDGRENALYLTTMTNFWVGNVIRPSFIYDEPGAFAFMVCATVAMREALGRPGRLSWLLILGGLITLSITHMLVLMMFLVRRIGWARTGLVATVLVGGVATLIQTTDEFDFVADRFTVDDGKLSGDNRSDQVANLLAVITPEMFLFGDVMCHDRPDRVCEEHGDISSSPATPVYRGGVVMLATQITVHVALVVAFLRQRRFRFPALVFTILLLQRPYFEGYGYGFFTYLLLFHMLAMRRKRTEEAR